MLSHPYRVDGTGRTASVTDERAQVRELMELVLFTRPGERVMRPDFGSGVHQLVFAPATDELAAVTQHFVRGALQQWLASWIEVRDVSVTAHDSELTVTVSYTLRRTELQDVATFRRTL